MLSMRMLGGEPKVVSALLGVGAGRPCPGLTEVRLHSPPSHACSAIAEHHTGYRLPRPRESPDLSTLRRWRRRSVAFTAWPQSHTVQVVVLLIWWRRVAPLGRRRLCAQHTSHLCQARQTNDETHCKPKPAQYTQPHQLVVCSTPESTASLPRCQSLWVLPRCGTHRRLLRCHWLATYLAGELAATACQPAWRCHASWFCHGGAVN